MTKLPQSPLADARVSDKRRRSRAALLLAALAGTTALLGAATAALFCRYPELWRAPPRSTTVFRVQSRSMEPAFRGPRFVWSCPQCGDSFATTLDVDSSGGVRSFDDAPVPPTDAVVPSETSLAPTPATTPETPTQSNANALNGDSPEVRKFRTSARFFPCPRCGFDRVPASSAVFQDGALVEATDATTAPRTPNAETAPTSQTSQTSTGTSVWNDWRRRIERVWNGEKTELRPERWAVVVFRAPTGRATLKRVVGLPGETVAIVNGDVFVDGRVPSRSLAQIVETSTRLDSTQFRRTDDRLTAVATTPIWNDAPSSPLDAPPNKFPQTIFKPTAIFNESPTPRWNGDDVAPIEPVRDFIFDFSWANADGTPTRFRLLARRPERAFLLDFDEAAQTLALRSTPLVDGRTNAGRPFEEATEADFANAPLERVALKAANETNAANETTNFRVFLVDGELVLTRDGDEIARFSTGDAESAATAPVSTPFVLVGDVARAFAPVLRRDLHYSSVAETTEPRDAGESPGYFLLGDNSPASLDSRFASFGTIETDALLFRVALPSNANF